MQHVLLRQQQQQAAAAPSPPSGHNSTSSDEEKKNTNKNHSEWEDDREHRKSSSTTTTNNNNNNNNILTDLSERRSSVVCQQQHPSQIVASTIQFSSGRMPHPLFQHLIYTRDRQQFVESISGSAAHNYRNQSSMLPTVSGESKNSMRASHSSPTTTTTSDLFTTTTSSSENVKKYPCEFSSSSSHDSTGTAPIGVGQEQQQQHQHQRPQKFLSTLWSAHRRSSEEEEEEAEMLMLSNSVHKFTPTHQQHQRQQQQHQQQQLSNSFSSVRAFHTVEQQEQEQHSHQYSESVENNVGSKNTASTDGNSCDTAPTTGAASPSQTDTRISNCSEATNFSTPNSNNSNNHNSRQSREKPWPWLLLSSSRERCQSLLTVSAASNSNYSSQSTTASSSQQLHSHQQSNSIPPPSPPPPVSSPLGPSSSDSALVFSTNKLNNLMSNSALQNSYVLSRLTQSQSASQPQQQQQQQPQQQQQQTGNQQQQQQSSPLNAQLESQNDNYSRDEPDYFSLSRFGRSFVPRYSSPFGGSLPTSTSTANSHFQQQNHHQQQQQQHPTNFTFSSSFVPHYQQPGFSTLLQSKNCEQQNSAGVEQESNETPILASSNSVSAVVKAAAVLASDLPIVGGASSLLIHDQFHHLTLEDKRRFEQLFKDLDLNRNGYIDFNDLVHALEKKGVKASIDNVKHIIDRQDRNLDGDIDFAEFVNYCLESEQKLHVLFKDIDTNNDGKIDAEELIHAFDKVGIRVERNEAVKLVSKIKSDKPHHKSFELNFEEFRDYLLLHPSNSIHDLLSSWRHGTFVDLGEDGIMPVDFSETEIQTGMWWRHLIAGGIAGAVSRTSTAPLDRLKVFLQVRGAEFTGLGNCLNHMIKEGGVISLWRGNGINVIKIAPETAIKFMAFDQTKRWINSNKNGGEINIVERFLAGSFAGAFSQTVIYPMEVLKTRFCLRQTGQYSGLFDAARKINAQGGLRNFYRGYVPNLIGIIPYAGIDLTIYETLKKMYLKHNSMEDAPVFVCLACGTISSTFGQIASYPLALVRTRMQYESGPHRSSMIGMFRAIWEREGPRGLYRGITANIMKVAPAVSISYVVYEHTRKPLGAIMS